MDERKEEIGNDDELLAVAAKEYRPSSRREARNSSSMGPCRDYDMHLTTSSDAELGNRTKPQFAVGLASVGAEDGDDADRQRQKRRRIRGKQKCTADYRNDT